ncbi:uncharacterized protein LOC132200268 [Neocloeon triangulifer]|uniref:uncharacterized protein LOC132200268 n=1 Tax=Neocloeon triangulifer TaxID=2078957 RepID=UPI00286F6A16|nr:uncharacterized protein LOC132200268 [Neocloeon triangulifer]
MRPWAFTWLLVFLTSIGAIVDAQENLPIITEEIQEYLKAFNFTSNSHYVRYPDHKCNNFQSVTAVKGCSSVLLCLTFRKKPLALQVTCRDGHSFDFNSQTCVPSYKLNDSCLPRKSRFTLSRKCPNGEGLYPSHASCSKFYRCIDTGFNNGSFTIYEFDCADGTYFDSELQSCQQDISARCTRPSLIIRTTPTPMEVLPLPSNCSLAPPNPQAVNCTSQGLYPDSSDCAAFYRCQSWQASTPVTYTLAFIVYFFRCPAGTIFYPQALGCVQPDLITTGLSCSNSSASLVTQIPPAPPTKVPETDGTPTPNAPPSVPTGTATPSVPTGTATPSVPTGTATPSMPTGTATPSPSVPTGTATPSPAAPDPTGMTPSGPPRPPTEATPSPTAPPTKVPETDGIPTKVPPTGKPDTPATPTPATPTVPANTQAPPGPGTDVVCTQISSGQHLFVCPSGFRRHPEFCDRFYQCAENSIEQIELLVLSCAQQGFVFDDAGQRCRIRTGPYDQHCAFSKPANRSSPHHDYITRQQYTKTHPEVDGGKALCMAEGTFSFPSDCQHFVKCTFDEFGILRGTLKRCPEGFIFWAVSRRCELELKVAQRCPAKDPALEAANVSVDYSNIGQRSHRMMLSMA